MPPASFQGNRDESTNVDMTVVQRDAQVGVVARCPSGLPVSGHTPAFLLPEGGALGWKEQLIRSGSQTLSASGGLCCGSPVRPWVSLASVGF